MIYPDKPHEDDAQILQLLQDISHHFYLLSRLPECPDDATDSTFSPNWNLRSLYI